MKNTKKICFAVLISTLMLIISSCYTPSPLYGTWTDNDGNKIMFMDDGSFSARIVDSSGTSTNYEGAYTVIDNIISFKITTPSAFTRVSEWDIRGAILYVRFEGQDKALILYHTARQEITLKKLLSLFAVLLLSVTLFAQEAEGYNFKYRINEGVSFGQITRIEVMENRSNFVRENMLIGAFCNFQTVDLYEWVDFTCQVAAYYPFYNAFNGMKQNPKNKLNYAVDGFLGATVTYDKIKWVPIDLSLGMHTMYQLTDEYHMVYLGLGFLGTLNFPLTENWTIVNNYFFSYDNPNLGGNKKVQKFDASYQYHIDLGFRYSVKAKNSYYYIAKKQAL